ncbi:MAG: MBL fold metallo-hydrolase [Deltaproteobacteria bacterium]|jgi:metallo-beta-lactamase family protein|nr:MBL fold metallo-hydrolase [Deltaproteobacteria bacterium]
MKIRCLGAVRTVTGSCFQVENPVAKGGYTLLDCGLFQGGRQTELRNFNTPLYKPDEVGAIVITHAHMDHSGLVPRLVKGGYKGPVYASEATAELLEILWEDAANIQEHEATWKTRKNSRQGQKKVEPLYTQDDAKRAMGQLRPLGFGKDIEVAPGLYARYFTAGHILGAASVQLTSSSNGKDTRVLFSGDLGRQGQLIVPDPEAPARSDFVFMETTYGDRLHKDLDGTIKEFFDVIGEAIKEGGKILIPAFAVERTQEIIYLLSQAWHEGRIPKELPVILDSPLAIRTSEVYLMHPELYDAETKLAADKGLGPEQMGSLKITRTMQESQAINDIKGPAIIVAGSGMANAGRILHHLKHNLWRPNCHVIFVGFQAQGTTGRRLVDGAETVKIFREPITVKAKIHTIGGFSGHADQNELIEWLRPQIHERLGVALIHGEEAGTLAFQARLKALFPSLRTEVPHWLETLEIAPGEAKSELPEISPAVAAGVPTYKETAEYRSMLGRLARLRQSFEPREAPFQPAELANLEALLNMAEEIILR